MANATCNQDFLQNDTQNVTVDKTTITVEQNSTASAIENITADDNGTVQSNETSNNATNNSTSKLDVKGPNLNGTDLNINGPKIDDNDPNFSTPSYQFFIINYSKIFINHPDWEIDEIIKSVIKYHPFYKAPKMVSEAYVLALQVKGDEMLYKDGLTEKEVSEYITYHPDRLFQGYEDYPGHS